MILWLQPPSTVILEPRKIKSVTAVSAFYPSICHEVVGPDTMMLVFQTLSFKPAFSPSSFTLMKRLFSSSLLSATKVVSFAYLRLLIFLPAVLIPACDSSSLSFHVIHNPLQYFCLENSMDSGAWGATVHGGTKSQA